MKSAIFIFAAGLMLAITMTGIAQAERYVVVNGIRLGEQDIGRLEQLHCGPIPNGNYWFDSNTGIWGYARNPVPQGTIFDNCIRPQRRRTGSPIWSSGLVTEV